MAHDDGAYAIHLTGDVRMVLCLSFDKFIRSMFDDVALKSVVFDLRTAEAVDSTTLGMMAKIALQCMHSNIAKPVLLTQSRGMLRLFESMGFDEIFVISDGIGAVIDNLQSLNCEGGDETLFKKQVIDAHKVLMSLNENNRQAFEVLVESLEKSE